ncbi:MAG: MBL fold metallo-hydrolase [Candidatus Vogelbacteria bacterium]|nr:MBL fold metallo-hydrolase [Candidatus Vogelbacteria bacterium]
MPEKKIKITFCGGVGEVTGANFLLEADGLPKMLIDCGLFQGGETFETKNQDEFPYNPAEIEYLFVTHAHLDHIGRIPYLVKKGFRGKIYSTPPTKEIAEYALMDSLRLLQKDRDEKDPFFEEKDVRQTFALWETAGYHEPLKIGDLTVILRDAGHILGSTMFEFNLNGKKLVMTGDLGNSPSPLLEDTEKITDADYLVMESVYGDRNHEDRAERKSILEDVIEDTIRANGTLMIPAFSIERTQEILYEIEGMMQNSRIPLVPVFLDSPLGIEVTAIYKKYSDYLNEAVRKLIKTGDVIFQFPQLHKTISTADSKAIFSANAKKIIIAGSGMSVGGRILHHERHYLGDRNSTLLLVGYQSVGSLGRQIQDGARSVRIMGEQISVNARVVNIHGYSSHKDSDHLLEFVRDTADTVKKVMVVMGEPKASLFLSQRIRDYLGTESLVPMAGQAVEISM